MSAAERWAALDAGTRRRHGTRSQRGPVSTLPSWLRVTKRWTCSSLHSCIGRSRTQRCRIVARPAADERTNMQTEPAKTKRRRKKAAEPEVPTIQPGSMSPRRFLRQQERQTGVRVPMPVRWVVMTRQGATYKLTAFRNRRDAERARAKCKYKQGPAVRVAGYE